MGIIDLFPSPRNLIETGDRIDLDAVAMSLVAAPTATGLVARGIELATPDLPTSGTPYRIAVSIDPDRADWPEGAGRDEAYRLELGVAEGTLIGASDHGTFYGCQTLRQLFSPARGPLPTLEIVDWPDFRYRGLYVENKWGTDLMTLDDWKAAVDDLAARKFNSLGIGVYGCWVVQYGGKRTEFVMLPFPDHPGMETPKTLRYYSPASDAWETLSYLPTMVTEDFFGEIVAYAKARNITVRPHFNSPGHNTVIPRAHPRISSKTPDGTPKGYGFCLSDPSTYDVILGLYNSVIERYLRPHGIDWFHIGLDEVQAYLGVDESRPFEALDPWCECERCRDRPHDRQLQDYAIRVCTHLRDAGINHITMWNDALDKLGAINPAFVAMLDEAGLRDHVAIQYWRYHPPVLVPPASLGLRTWSTPMAGYWPSLFTVSYTSNILNMLLHGHQAGVEGADAYCLWDRGFDRNYACLAQFSWNLAGEDVYQFKSRYARSLLTPQLSPPWAGEAFSQFDQVFDAQCWAETHLASLLYYWHTYPRRRQTGTYPRDMFLDLRSGRMRERDAFARVSGSAQAATELFAEAGTDDPRVVEHRVEAAKFAGVWEAYTHVLGAIDAFEGAMDAAGVERAATLAEQGRVRFRAVMVDLETFKARFLVPQILRDLSIVYLYIDRLGSEMQSVADALRSGKLTNRPAFLDLPVNGDDLDRFVSTDVEAQAAD